MATVRYRGLILDEINVLQTVFSEREDGGEFVVTGGNGRWEITSPLGKNELNMLICKALSMEMSMITPLSVELTRVRYQGLSAQDALQVQGEIEQCRDKDDFGIMADGDGAFIVIAPLTVEQVHMFVAWSMTCPVDAIRAMAAAGEKK
jgi:hypothetical protein